MKVLLTGGNGFLGYHLQKELNKENVQFVAPRSNEFNLLNLEDVYKMVEKHQPEAIVHGAAVCGGIKANKKSPADFIHLNIKMASNIFDAINKYKIPYLYSLGTVCSYPLHCPIPFKEDNIFDGKPESTNFPYGLAKRAQMIMHQSYMKQYGLKGGILVPVNMYGSHDHFDLENSHVIPALIRKFLSAKEENKEYVEVWGTGKATREFLHAEDSARAIVKAVKMKLNFPEPINIGTGESISIYNLAYLIKELTGYRGDVVFTGAVSDGQPKRQLDVSRAKEILGFEAKVGLRKGLEETIRWYKDNR